MAIISQKCPITFFFKKKKNAKATYKIAKNRGRIKNKMYRSLPIGVIKLWNDKRIPNLVSEFK